MATKAKKTAPKAPRTDGKGKKPPSQARLEAIARYEAAKDGDDKQATKVALQALKILRFREVVVPRTQKALVALNRLENLTNKAVYSWTLEEAQKVIGALQAAVTDLQTKFFAEDTKEERAKFTL